MRDEGSVVVPGLAAARASFMAEGMARMGYDRCNLGGSDRALSQGDLEQIGRRHPGLLLSADLRLSGEGPSPWTDGALLEAGGRRLGVIGMAPGAGRPGDALAAAGGVAGRLRREGCLLVTLLAAGDEAGFPELAAATGLFDVVVVAGGAQPSATVSADGGTLVVTTGSKGSHLGVLDILASPGLRDRWRSMAAAGAGPAGGRVFRWEAVPLDEAIPPDPDMLLFLERYREALSRLVPAFASPDGPAYVGANRCAACHPVEFREWLTTSHAQGFAALVERGAERNPECLPCHTTGYGRSGGFQGHRSTPHMEGVQCESCHGPGSGHPPDAGAEGAAGEGNCRRCHDAGNSPDFSYDGYVEMLGGHIAGGRK